MTGITSLSPGKIGRPHQYIVGRRAVLQMAAKVSAMAGDALVVAGVAGCAALQSAIVGRIMAGLTTVGRMHLARADKRCAGGAMTAGAVRRVRRCGHIRRHLQSMIMRMAIKVGAVAGLAAFSLALTRGDTDSQTGRAAVTGLTAEA